MKNIHKVILLLALLAPTPAVLVSCVDKQEKEQPEPKKDPEPKTDPDPKKDPEPESGLPSFSSFTLGSSFDIPLKGSLVLPYKDVKKGDVITVTPRTGGTPFTLTCSDFNEKDGGSFNVPSRYIGGMATLNMNVAGRNLNKLVFINIVDTQEVEKKPGKTTYGRVVDWDGKPIPGVAVSDGVLVTTTDENGCYYLSSQRYYGYVFISTPSGYRTAIREAIPQFHQNFTSTTSSTYEQHNFVLQPQSDIKHRVMTFTDEHVARRTDDINKFNTYFKPEIPKQAAAAASEGYAFCCISLGDQAWDQFWYDNKFDLASFKDLLADLDVPIYYIPGNHDNDPLISNDFNAENAFRKYMGPTFYSFNMGNIHYILMDDTVFNNKGGDVQDYQADFTANEMKWLKADLATVSPGSTIVFGTHIQYTTRPRGQSDGSFKFFYETINASTRMELVEMFAPYNVHWISGHTHVNYTNRISERLIEHNTASVCSTWWWTAYYTGGRSHLCTDGSPSGYRIFEMGEDGKDSVKWRYQAYARDASYQFRAYDMNNCQITRSLYIPNNTKLSETDFSNYAHGYETARSDNHLYVNVFDYDEGWTVTATEDGRQLKVVRIDAYDPLHILHFNMQRINSSNTASPSMTFPTVQASHFFDIYANSATSPVTITATDSFGRKYVETVTRPRKLSEMSKSNQY